MEPGQASVVRGLPAQPRLGSRYKRAVQNMGLFGRESRPIKRGILSRVQRSQRNASAPVISIQKSQVDLKKVKAVRKALHELEKSEWFSPQRAE
jgi:hypothetical protein